MSAAVARATQAGARRVRARRVALLVTAAVALVLIRARVGWTHPIHTTLTEISYLPADRTIHIAIRVFLDDFGAAVTGRTHVALARDGAVPDSAAFAYARATFALADRAGRPLALQWCGARRAENTVLLCLRAVGPSALAGLRVLNAMHFELYHDQVNIVQAVSEGRRESMLFTRGDRAKTLR